MTTASHKFVIALALVSIVGFLGIISATLFNFDMSFYVEAMLMIIIGLGFVVEGEITKLGRMKHEGLTPKNFTKLITVIIGVLAVLTGVFSIPAVRIEASGFLAVKGIIAVIAIVVIVIQTWVVE
ncbi:MAG: hypothetical protein KJ718_02395 [Nanoarchaeota archaeon]|nr:hypothetical protein [Nanoarchaeota archaeon]